MAKKVTIQWQVFEKATNERVEEVSHTTVVNDFTEIQPKVIDKISTNYKAKALEKDLKLQDKLSASGDRGGYVIVEIVDDPKTHDIVIFIGVLTQ